MVGKNLVGMIEETLDDKIQQWENEAKLKFVDGEVRKGTTWRPDKKDLEETQRLIQVHQMTMTLHMAKEQRKKMNSNLAIPRN